MRLTIVASRVVCFTHGYDGFGIPSQVTHVRVGRVDAYVREARRASSAEHFAMSSGARLGHKADGNRIGREALELAAPTKAWSAIAELVAELDTELQREVLRSARWSLARAAELFASKRRRDSW